MMIAKNYLVSVVPSLLLLVLSMAIISMEGSVVVLVEARPSLARGVAAANRRLTTSTTTAADAPSSSSSSAGSSNASAAAPSSAAATTNSNSPSGGGGGGVTRTSGASTVYPTMETIGSIASRTSSVDRATREPMSAGMKFETPKTASRSSSTASSNSKSKPSSSLFDSTTIDVANTSTTGSGGNDTSSSDGNATGVKDDDYLAYGSSNGDDDTVNIIYSSSNNSTFLSKPLTIPKEKEQPKQWPETVAGIFLLGGFVFFFATCYRNHRRRRDYQQIPVALTV